MGNMMKRNPAAPAQGDMYPPVQQPPLIQQPMMVQQPAMIQQPALLPQPTVIQQQPAPMVQQPMMAQSVPFRPAMYPQQPPSFRPSFPSTTPFLPRHSSPPFSLPGAHNTGSYFENDAFLSSLTGWSAQDIERLRHEFLAYANPYGVIDREGFRKLYIASLLNMTWEAIEHDSEAAFRNFDINQTGVLDFNEYITACSRMTREVNAPYMGSSPPPPITPSYTY